MLSIARKIITFSFTGNQEFQSKPTSKTRSALEVSDVSKIDSAASKQNALQGTNVDCRPSTAIVSPFSTVPSSASSSTNTSSMSVGSQSISDEVAPFSTKSLSQHSISPLAVSSPSNPSTFSTEQQG